MSRNSFLKKIGSSCLIFIAAIWIMLEEWIWDSITSLMQRISRLPLVASLEARIANLNPYVSVLLFLVPMFSLVPVKLYAAYLIATGAVVRGIVFVVTAKIVGTAIITKLFLLCKPQFMTIPLFERGYLWVIRTKDYLYTRLEEMQAWKQAKELVKRAKAWIRNIKERYSGKGSLIGRLKAIRARVRRKKS